MSSVISKSSPWGQAGVSKAIKFQDIINDQLISTDNELSKVRQAEDEDYQFALLLQNEDLLERSSIKVVDEDEQLAECLQRIANEEKEFDSFRPTSQPEFSKVSVQSGHNVNQSNKKQSVVSSSFVHAMELEHSLQHSSRDVQQLFKHDALLQGLSNSASLSELHGVGDLLGSKLLVNNTVANSLKTFVHKNEDRQIQMKMNKSRKTQSKVLSVSLSPTVPIVNGSQEVTGSSSQE